MAGETLSPCGRENSPYRHPANKDSISTPELGGVFVFPASRIPAYALCEPIRERNLLKPSRGRPRIASPPESPGALCNHLCRFSAAWASMGNVVSFPPTAASAIPNCVFTETRLSIGARFGVYIQLLRLVARSPYWRSASLLMPPNPRNGSPSGEVIANHVSRKFQHLPICAWPISGRGGTALHT
jgi:hypothetical protein